MTPAGSMKHKINLFFHSMVEFAGGVFSPAGRQDLRSTSSGVAHVCAGIAVRYHELWQRGSCSAAPYVMIVAMYRLHGQQQNLLHAAELIICIAIFTQS